MKVLFEKPAKDFFEALPIGNGRLGGMIYGDILREELILNESSMWSGSRQDADREDAAEYLPQIRALLKEGKNYEAEKLFGEHFTCKGAGTAYANGAKAPFGCYQLLGSLHISYFQAVSAGRQDSCGSHNYERYLDLDTGVVTTAFEVGGKKYRREYFASKEQEAVFVHLTCDEPGQMHFSCGLSRDELFKVEKLKGVSYPAILMHGQLSDGINREGGICYGAVLSAVAKGGEVWAEEQRVHVKGADEAWIIVTARTDLSGFMGKNDEDAILAACEDMAKARTASWEEVQKAWKEWYGSQYHSFALFLGGEDNDDVPVKTRLKNVINGERDNGLVALYVQYARYLLITSSQKGGFAANLQGIWAEEIQTPWNGDWHLNAQQMIYWLAEKGNLSDCHVPYLELTKELVEPGKKTAKSYYGAKGFLVHTCTNPWGFTSPCEDAAWGSTTGSGAWQCHHLWEHYLYTMDKEYLAEVYPVMKSAMEFYMDMLVENEKGYLVTSPSSSPENSFLDEQGRICSLCEGPAYDRELILALAGALRQAQYVLKNDTEFIEKLKEIEDKLAPIEIASDGRIKEWSKEYEEPMPYHRHVSHLWGAYPGSLISHEQTPQLAKAALKSLEKRGRTTAGWAISYRMCLWARLRRAEEAYECLQDAFRFATAYNLFNLAYHCDETSQNPILPDNDNETYPFQIDGNQGNAAGVLMMILDDEAKVKTDGSMESHIYLLPALPKAFADGHAKGIKTKGGMEVELSWEAGKLTHVHVTGKAQGSVFVHYNGQVQELSDTVDFEKRGAAW